MNRRELLTGAAALALTSAVPSLALPLEPAAKLLSFIVGSDGESDWEWVKAVDKADAIAEFMMSAVGLDRCEVETEGGERPEDCECEYCYRFGQLGEPTRVKEWDARDATKPPTPADWIRAGFSYTCPCGTGGLEWDDGTFICDDGTVECESCHDKRINTYRRRRDLARSRVREWRRARAEQLAKLEAPPPCGHANAGDPTESLSAGLQAVRRLESAVQDRDSG